MTGSGTIEKRKEITGIDRWDKARKVVEAERVKLDRFLPSGRTIWTVAGSECNHLVDCRTENKPYCSCDDFYFRVLSGKIPECYHLIAAKRAIKEDMYTVIEHRDDELPSFLGALLESLFAHIS
ncbi:MAG: hypothetical protein ACREBS_09805 [Nitrososphaerales archaeon]